MSMVAASTWSAELGGADRTAGHRLVSVGHELSQQGRFGEAEEVLRRAVALVPAEAMAHNNLGWVLEMQGATTEAVACYERALKADPQLRFARRNLATLLVRIGRTSESLGLWRDEIATGDMGVAWVDSLISAAMAQRDLTLAGEYAAILTRLRWGIDLVAAHPPVYMLSLPKLQHDVEQFRYLQRQGVLGPEMATSVDAYERVIDRLGDTEGRVPLDADAEREIGRVYNRVIHVRETPRLDRALSTRWNPNDVESQYLHRRPGVVVVDDFLTAQALDELRAFCLESTIWSANRYMHGRLGAFFRDGFNCPLLLQIAEELRAALPNVIGDRYPLRQMWGFKNASSVPPDSSIHADFAAVNVNFWITPDEANLDDTTGGFIVYEVDAPLDWDFATYNGRPDLITAYLRRHRARRMEIPYRSNRAIIFNSDLFHETAEVRFRPGYENRRVNITMLYGHRENDVHHGMAGADPGALGPPAWRSAALAPTRRPVR